MNDEIDDFDRSVNNAKTLDHLLECFGKKVFVKANDHALFSLSIKSSKRPSDKIVKLLKRFVVIAHSFTMQCFEHRVHRNGNRIVRSEGVIFEQSVENWSRNDVLRQHLNSIVFAGRRIDIFAKPGEK